jgi:ATP-dependent HslUV protease ATP-binding subunit HslU
VATPRSRLSEAAAVRISDEGTLDFSTVLEDLSKALTPIDTVAKLDQYIVGQAAAKRAVAIAMRNRWRRHQLPADIKRDVIPKNILMIGPTGCGKTEIARRISKIAQAPFIKVEATKFTEVGFHGRDVDMIIKDLVEASIVLTKKKEAAKLQAQVHRAVEDRVIEALTGGSGSDSQRSFRELYRNGALDDRQITVEVKAAAAKAPSVIAVDSPAMMGEMLGKLSELKGKRSEKRAVTVAEARPIIEEQELERMMQGMDIIKAAIAAVEESGIVFIDEIDKICAPSGKYRGADASAEGVQRDLLPLIEGCVISTKHGDVNTDFILFIASGAFHSVKPSDMLAELQGRLPIKVTLKGLTEDDMYRILTEPVTNLIRQQVELLKTEGVELVFAESALREVARTAVAANTLVENLGARRLHAVIETIMEDISYGASAQPAGHRVEVTEALVKERLKAYVPNKDMAKHIL